ncbi:Retrovirus-related Pol polyprotein from transposon TNT 1-94 [Vitis vinifera]|uniref:Retrovirus-related Pol polyprotein from transposon TNT 1-94 n=1 Tax=Vitis vinifera TaxID=29760 RepID=A0A438BR97_VITVI|nr:Retrovirus-related Pol polyprotein from transposon TNT 1-94 [Vitis vinifera]
MVLSCYHRFDVNYQGPRAPASSTSQIGLTPPAQAMMAAPSSASMDSWFLDSGATHHLSHTAANIHNGTPYNGTDSVMVGNGKSLPITQVGHSFLHTPAKPFVLHNVLHVPQLTSNLISVSKFCTDSNTILEFHPSSFFVKDKDTKVTLLQGQLERGLYKFPTSSISSPTASPKHQVFLTKTQPTTMLWHQRFGHPSGVILQKIFIHVIFHITQIKQLMFAMLVVVPKVTKFLFLCPLPGPPLLLNSSMQTCGDQHLFLPPQVPRYFLLLMDDYSRFVWFYLLPTKDQVHSTFVQFKTLVENQFQTTIKCLQTDHGGEFIALTKFLSLHGILHRFSCPYTPEQNGRVERKMRHVVETGLTLLYTATLPSKFWPYAFTTAVTLINCMPSPLLNYSSPFSLLYKHPPDYFHFKVFGCLCYPHLKHLNSNKFQPRSTPCIFLGYAPSHKGYLCLNPTTNRVYISRHVVFAETTFPFQALSLPSQQSYHIPVTPTFPLPPSPILFPPTTSSPLATPSELAPTSPPASSLSLPPLIQVPFVDEAAETPTTSLQDSTAPIPGHPMITRSKSGICKKKTYLTSLTIEPRTVKQALQDPNWKIAMEQEYQALLKNQTWSLVPPPSNAKIIGCKWVFKLKHKPNGSIDRYKARLVAQGFHQTYGIDFFETFSPVVKPCTIRLVLSIAVFMMQPPGFEDNSCPTHVCRLQKALYGLKQAPRAWFHKLSSFLLQIGFQCSRADASLFYFHSASDIIILLIYVDDILITGSNPSRVHQIISQLSSHFALRDLGDISYFLGIEVTRLSHALHLNQQRYIHQLLERANLHEAKSANTPGALGKLLSAADGEPLSALDATHYRSLVGALQYITLTRPEISFVVNRACQYMARPTTSHLQAAKRILRYLKGTATHGISIHASPSLSLQGYTDADWASCPDDRRSTKSEYRALALLAAEVSWVQFLLKELCIPQQDTPLIWCDNISATALAANSVFHARSKHIEIDLHFVRDKFSAARTRLSVVPRPVSLRGDDRQTPTSVADASPP